MEYREIKPGILEGRFKAPPSKSITHRLLIIAALSGQECRVQNPLLAEDTLLTLSALKQIGFVFTKEKDGILFSGKRETPGQPVRIEVANSGTTARLMTAVAASQPGEFIIDGSPRMRERPMKPLLDALLQLGVHIENNNGKLPLRIQGGKIKGGAVQVNATKSSQFLSALLLIAPLTADGLTIIPQGEIASEAYVEMTLALMRRNGIEFNSTDKEMHVPGKQEYRMTTTAVEGDYSSASYFIIGAAIGGGKIAIENLQPDSLQGDRVILDILESAGCVVNWSSDSVSVQGTNLNGIEWDMKNSPDLAPGVGVMALFAQENSRLRRLHHLKFKESDRLAVLAQNIRLLGGDVSIEGEDLLVRPVPLNGSDIPVHNDHRMAMSFALAGLRVPGIRIENPQCVSKSFPKFWDEFDRLRNDIK